MTRSRCWCLPALLLIALLASACSSRVPELASRPPSNPTPAPDMSPRDPLVACDLTAQAAAMHPDHLPDWEAIGISTCYELRLDLSPPDLSYTGTARITHTNRSAQTLTDLVFRTYPNARVIYGGELQITAARVNEETIRPVNVLADGTAVRLDLPVPLVQGASALVELDFSGRVPADFGGLPDVYGVFNYATEEQVLTLANWYPLLANRDADGWQFAAVSPIGDAVVSQTALYRVSISAPLAWQVVTTGSVIGEQAEQDTRRIDVVSGPVRDFSLAASPGYVMRTAMVDGVRVRHWGLPGGEGRWEEALQAMVDSLEVFNRRFGPYPFAELDALAAPMDNAAGVEYPGLFLVLDSLYAPDQERPFLLGIIISHEVAHQWWYSVVGNDVLSDPWQDEALAVFGSLVFQEVHQPRFYRGTLEFYRDQVALLADEANDTAVAQPVSAFVDQPRLYGLVVYQKGGVSFSALRELMGEEAFYRGLRAYYSNNQFKLASPDELLSAFEGACSCQLDAFYAEWGLSR